jgi:hypothetical protein
LYIAYRFRQLSSRIIWSCSKAVYKPVWHIPLLSVQWINSWWWTYELSETCRFSCQNKFVKLVHLVGFIIKKFVTMHGHMNVRSSICVRRRKRPGRRNCEIKHWDVQGVKIRWRQRDALCLFLGRDTEELSIFSELRLESCYVKDKSDGREILKRILSNCELD